MSDPSASSAFGRLVWSNMAAQSADQIALSAAPLVAVLLLGAGERETGLLQAALTLPFLLLAIPAGWLTDRMPRPALMAGAESARAAALLATVLLIQTGSLDWTLLTLLGFVAASGTVVYSVAAPALIPALVPSSALAAANSRIELARTLAYAGGPALGGAVVGWMGGGTAFAMAAGLSLLAVLLLGGLHDPVQRAPSERHPLRDIAEGLSFVAGHPLLRPVLATQFLYGTAYFLMMAVFVPYGVRQLGLSASGIGLTLSCMGTGMVAGALLAPAVFRRLRFGTVVAIGPVTGLTASILMALTIGVPAPWLAALSLFLFGAGPILWTIGTTTLRQAVTPDRLQGRVSAAAVLTYASRPLGSLLGALAGETLGAEACLLLAVGGFAIQALVILLSPAVTLRSQPEPAAQPT